jgi:Dolichyl-phosphate-mannose-protein mannosyltransferase
MLLLGRARTLTASVGVEATIGAALLALAFNAFSRGLHARAAFDEGVYLASLGALDHGQHLGTQVFASQPPGFYLLLQMEGAVFGGNEHSVRLAMVLVALVGVAASYWIGRRIAGRPGGIATSALYIATPPIATEAARVHADLPSAVLALVAVGCALEARRSHALPFAALSGVFFAAAVSVKLDSVIVALPLIALTGWPRSFRALGAWAAGAASLTAALLVSYAGSLSDIWRQAVTFHAGLESSTGELLAIHAPTTTHGNVVKLANVLTDYGGLRDPLPWIALLGVAAALYASKKRVGREGIALWFLSLLALSFLALHKPLWAHHVVLASASLATAVGTAVASVVTISRRRQVLTAALSLAFLVGTARLVELAIRYKPPAELPAVGWAAQALRDRTRPQSYVASDLPIVTVLAGRLTPGPLVDTSNTRLAAGQLSPTLILATIVRSHVSAVVVARGFRDYPRVLAGVRARFPHHVSSRGITIYLRN